MKAFLGRKADRLRILHIGANWVMVVTFMCTRGHAPHVVHGLNHCKRMASLNKHTVGAITNSKVLKFFQVRFLVLTHSACPCKNYAPKCFQKLRLFKYFQEHIIIKGGARSAHALN